MLDESTLKKIYLMLGSACNLKCRHCYETDVPQPRLKKEIHKDVWDYLERIKSNNVRPMELLFWGGEPLLYWKLIQEVVERFGKGAFNYAIMSNGVLLTDDKVDFINQYDIGYTVSNDGPLTAKVRGVNVFDDDEFCKRFMRIKRKCIGVTTHAYNIDPYVLCDYIKSRIGDEGYFIFYQYLLECTFNMDSDLYAYDFKRFEAIMKRCREDYVSDFVTFNRKGPGRLFLRRGVNYIEDWLIRKEKGLPDEWYPDCLPMRKDINIDILGFVHACHNRASVIGRVTDTYEELLESNDKYFRAAMARKPECDSCEALPFCRHGCPLNPMSAGQKICCDVEKLYWRESLKTVKNAHLQGISLRPFSLRGK